MKRTLGFLAATLLSAALVTAGSTTAAYADDQSGDLTQSQNLTGTSSSYWNNKHIATNRPTGLSTGGFATKPEYEAKAGGKESLIVSKPFTQQLACGSEVVNFTDCDLTINITSNYLNGVMNNGNKNGNYEPQYGINELKQYFAVVQLVTVSNGVIVVDVPIFVQKGAGLTTTRVPFGAMPFSFVFMNNSGCLKLTSANSCGQGFQGLDTCRSAQSQKIALQNAPLLSPDRIPTAEQPWYWRDQGFVPSASQRGQTVRQWFHNLAADPGREIVQVNVGIVGFNVNDYAMPTTKNAIEFVQDPLGAWDWLLNGGTAGEDNTCATVATLGTDPSEGVAGGFLHDGTKQADGSFDGNGFTRMTKKCSDTPMQPLSNLGGCNMSFVGQDFLVFKMTTENIFNSEACRTDFDCESPGAPASDWLSKPGNTTDLPGVNCGDSGQPACKTRCVTCDFKPDNKTVTVHPYTNPGTDRPTISECFGDTALVPFKIDIDWDCMMLALFSPSLEELNTNLNSVYPSVQRVLFPVAYAVRGYSVVSTFVTSLGSDSCSPWGFNAPHVPKKITLLGCPADSPTVGTITSYTRVLIPWFLSFLVGLLFVRRLMNRFGFGGGSSLDASAIESVRGAAENIPNPTLTSADSISRASDLFAAGSELRASNALRNLKEGGQ